ncbi:MAG: response regulator transcription factor [Alphaproteobacteria bacterium]|nr:response regulator transcription factor [Alphaproteobacteria bacterium]MBU1513839.1 response regulator transcription factor [Alphaproteobacteria bacterium]MBU2094516.1 response regulator transcription factor [Alphaproteobacteria bacterium]MBU2151223.1 response regulator transcription factor [Alphaproteobacteria bacterium]MBU2310038.1 response regulator transcription factor [Alphaproteobacteria bacterium]
MQVLVVESQAAAAKSLELLLTAEGHTAFVTGAGEEACDLARLYDYDAIFLSLTLDDMTGVQLIRALRTRKIAAPVIALGDGQVETRVEALAAGADDVMTKPFHKGELLARLAAVVRRSCGHADSILRTGNIALNLATRQAEIAGQPIHLTPSEYKMLELFSLRKNTALSKEQCLSHLYNGMSEPEPKIIDVFVCKLRKKIAAVNGGDAQIETVWGGGYMLRDAPAQRLAA